jgi:hypothetical protein
LKGRCRTLGRSKKLRDRRVGRRSQLQEGDWCRMLAGTENKV